jgi:hypothetical protein
LAGTFRPPRAAEGRHRRSAGSPALSLLKSAERVTPREATPAGRARDAALGTLQLHVEVPRGRSPAGTVVALAGTPYRAITDTAGNAVIADLLPGPYTVEALDPHLARLGIAIPTSLRFVAVRDSAMRLTTTIPTAEEYARGKCAVAAKRLAVSDSVFILGRVATSEGKPIAHAKVTSAIRVQPGVWRLLPGAYTTGTDGIFQVCSSDLFLNAIVRIKVELTSRDSPTETEERLTTNLTVVPVRAGADMQLLRHP